MVAVGLAPPRPEPTIAPQCNARSRHPLAGQARRLPGRSWRGRRITRRQEDNRILAVSHQPEYSWAQNASSEPKPPPGGRDNDVFWQIFSCAQNRIKRRSWALNHRDLQARFPKLVGSFSQVLKRVVSVKNGVCVSRQGQRASGTCTHNSHIATNSHRQLTTVLKRRIRPRRTVDWNDHATRQLRGVTSTGFLRLQGGRYKQHRSIRVRPHRFSDALSEPAKILWPGP